MTPTQKETIALLRTDGRSYGEIANHLGINRDAVISFCRRNLPKQPVQAPIEADGEDQCRQCGSQLIQRKDMKTRVFCCDACRIKWWSEHPEKLNKKAVYNFTCAHCGKAFSAYGNRGRKYCSHECYIEDRFGSTE